MKKDVQTYTVEVMFRDEFPYLSRVRTVAKLASDIRRLNGFLISKHLISDLRKTDATSYEIVFRLNAAKLSDIKLLIKKNKGIDWCTISETGRSKIIPTKEKSEERTLSVYIDPGNASEHLLTEFYIALSAYYRSLGGSGLHINHAESRHLAGEMA